MASIFPYRTTVDVAASSFDLTDKATVKAEMEITVDTYDGQIDRNITQASDDIARYCDCVFAQEKVTDYFRLTAPTDSLWLSRAPVVTIHAVIEAGATLGVADYEVDQEDGRIWRLDGAGNRIRWATGAAVTVQHTSGYILPGEAPAALDRACVDQVRGLFQGRRRDPAMRSINVPDTFAASFSVGGGDGGIGKSGLLGIVEASVATFRRVMVG